MNDSKILNIGNSHQNNSKTTFKVPSHAFASLQFDKETFKPYIIKISVTIKNVKMNL